MNKVDFLSNPDTKSFIKWLAENFNTEVTAHSWNSRRPPYNVVQFPSLQSAFENYSWSFSANIPNDGMITGNSYSDNRDLLQRLKTGIAESINDNDNEETLAWSLAILQWGGVLNHNGSWLRDRHDLVSYLKESAKIIDNHGNQQDNLQIDRFNSGMSKIYSLLCQNFVIYDSRVAAAIGLYLKRWMAENKIKEIPEPLRFGMAEAKTVGVVRKLPGFPYLSQGNYARFNLRANWLLNAVIEHINSISGSKLELRHLESALFMMGYDLSNDSAYRNDAITNSVNPVEPDNIQAMPNINGFENTTFGGENKRKSFNFFIENDGLEFSPEPSVSSAIPKLLYSEISTLLNEIRCRHGENYFPLGNAVDNLNSPDNDGLGGFLYRIGSNNQRSNINRYAQCASYYGPALVDAGLLEWNGKNRGIAFRLTENSVFDENQIRGIFIDKA